MKGHCARVRGFVRGEVALGDVSDGAACTPLPAPRVVAACRRGVSVTGRAPGPLARRPRADGCPTGCRDCKMTRWRCGKCSREQGRGDTEEATKSLPLVRAPLGERLCPSALAFPFRYYNVGLHGRLSWLCWRQAQRGQSVRTPLVTASALLSVSDHGLRPGFTCPGAKRQAPPMGLCQGRGHGGPGGGFAQLLGWWGARP